MDGVPHVTNVEHYARIVKEKSLLRGTDSRHKRDPAAGPRSRGGRRRDSGPRGVLDLPARRRPRALGPGGLHDVVTENLERISRIYEGGQRITGLSTGYRQLDNLTSGLQPSELMILAARPSMGKTAFALNLAENVGVRGNKPVAIFSLEMSKESLLLRLLSADAQNRFAQIPHRPPEPRG